MQAQAEITADAVRQNLISRARAFCQAKKTSFSAIGKAAISDDRFLARVDAGGNFTLDTYQRVIDWLDAAEASSKDAA
jgi:hypothetical protein